MISLAQLDKMVVGLDRDWEMLKLLAQNVPHQFRQLVHFFQADFAGFHLDTLFGLVFMSCNTYSTLSKNKRQMVLALIRHHLEPGCLFAASLPNPGVILELPAHGESEIEQVISTGDGEFPIQISNSWERSDDTLTIHWHYDHLSPNGHVSRSSTYVVHNLVSVEEYLTELSDSGFRGIKLYGDFDLSDYVEHSPYLIFTAAL